MASSSSNRKKYDVFLSFRGEDTRNNFVSHLHAALEDNWIETFIDSDDLARGDRITSALEEAIENSAIAVVVFSVNYANSSWCLDELVKIMSCNATNGLIVMPVFYHVTPSDVRNQTGIFGQRLGFSVHNDAGRLGSWTRALAEVGFIAGWDVNIPLGLHEAGTVRNIVKTIGKELDRIPLSTDENLIGVGRRLRTVMSISSSGRDVFAIGIFGMGGSGKTAIAQVLFDDISIQFDGAKFIGNIRKITKDHDLQFLQNQVLSILPQNNVHVSSVTEGARKIKRLLSRKKVLIVLDDVDDILQLEALAGASNWFGEGSRIIITTRDRGVLRAHKLVKEICKVSLLDDEEAIQLVHTVAFGSTTPAEEFKEPLSRIIHYAAGLPYALKCLGSKFCGKPIEQWKCTLDSLSNFPETGIDSMLKWSLDGLKSVEKDLFLDIACFFNGWTEDEVVHILDSCRLFPKDGLVTLEEKSLITICKDCIHMHNLIQEMGRNIVRQENPDEPDKHSRLWHPEEVKDVLIGNKGTEKIKAIVMSNLHQVDASSATGGFSGMSTLRLLHLNTQKKILEGLGISSNAVQWIRAGPCSLTYLPDTLKWITWDFFNMESWPKDFQAKKLIGLQMRHSSMVNLYREFNNKPLDKLRFLDLSFSKELTRTPDFRHLPNLERLNLEFCSSLEYIHESIGVHERLVYLNLRFCEKLEYFTSTIAMKSLQILDLSGCSKLSMLAEFSMPMDCLAQLSLSHTSIEELPLSIGNLPALALLEINNCRKLICIPRSIRELEDLEILLYGCTILQE